MNYSEFQHNLLSAYDAGSLLTAKHDPNSLHVVWSTPRSVLSFDLEANLRDFIKSGDYSVVEYENLSYPATPKYWEITPAPSSTFSVPASGVNSFTPHPSIALDRLVVVSGKNQGLHIYGENSTTIQARLSAGALTLTGPLV